MVGIKPTLGQGGLQIPGGGAQVVAAPADRAALPDPRHERARLIAQLLQTGSSLQTDKARRGVLGAQELSALAQRGLTKAQQKRIEAETENIKALKPRIETQNEQAEVLLEQEEARLADQQTNLRRKQALIAREQEIESAALGGEEAYMDALKRLAPERHAKMKQAKVHLQNAQETVSGLQTKNKSAKLGVQKQIAEQLGAFGIAVHSFGNPQMRAQAYQKALPEIRKVYPTAPSKYDPTTVQLWIARSATPSESKPLSPEGKVAHDVQKGFLSSDAASSKVRDEKMAKLREQSFKDSSSLRKEFTAVTEDFVKVRDSFRRIQASGTTSSAAGDLALIFNYMKMLDPGSVVRESEFANAAASGSLGERFIAAGKRLLQGERLSPEMRKDFMDRAQKLMKSQQKGFNQIKTQFTDIAKRNDLNPKDVILDVDLTTDEKTGSAQGTLSASDINKQADEAIAAGKDPDLVNKRRQELLQRAQ